MHELCGSAWQSKDISSTQLNFSNPPVLHLFVCAFFFYYICQTHPHLGGHTPSCSIIHRPSYFGLTNVGKGPRFDHKSTLTWQGNNNDMLWFKGQVLLVVSWEDWGPSAAAHSALPVFTAADWNHSNYQRYWMLLTGGSLMEWLKKDLSISVWH